MSIRDLMSKDVKLVEPQTKVAVAARMMRKEDCGALPVGEGDKLVGVITDRDIVVRAIAEGKDPASTTVSEAMSDEVLYCFDDQTREEVAANMGEKQVRRMPVVDSDKRLVGIVSLGDLAVGGAPATASKALEQISEPG